MKSNKYYFVLKELSLFKNFSEEELLNLFINLNYKITTYDKDSLVFLEKEPCNTLNIILDGQLQIQKSDSTGKLLVVEEFRAGETIGETLIFGEPNLYPLNTICTTETTLLCIPRDAVISLCKNNQDFLVEFLRLISEKAIKLSQKLELISSKTIRERIIEFILMEYNKNENMKIPLSITKKKWADMMGVQRPSLSRELLRLKDEGLIDYNLKYIFIKDLDGIRRN